MEDHIAGKAADKTTGIYAPTLDPFATEIMAWTMIWSNQWKLGLAGANTMDVSMDGRLQQPKSRLENI